MLLALLTACAERSVAWPHVLPSAAQGHARHGVAWLRADQPSPTQLSAPQMCEHEYASCVRTQVRIQALQVSAHSQPRSERSLNHKRGFREFHVFRASRRASCAHQGPCAEAKPRRARLSDDELSTARGRPLAQRLKVLQAVGGVDPAPVQAGPCAVLLLVVVCNRPPQRLGHKDSRSAAI